MSHFGNLFAAWTVVWVIFFVYEVSIARRMARLRKDLEELKEQLRGK